ncbi:MAG: hypothetical protein KDD45_10300, partial [Bdellovibrionales bacterium]|nr:hypothetical protein [Bdellovibrionales bacterium]
MISNIKNKNENYMGSFFVRFGKLLWISVQEIYLAIVNETLPLWKYCGVGILFSYFLLFDLDIYIAKLFKIPFYIHPSLTKVILILFFAVSGLFIYGFERAYHRLSLMERLRKAFDYCELKSGGLYPSFIRDEPIDEFV